MNPYLALAFVAVWGGSCWYAFQVGKDVETAAQAREEKAAQVARDAALQVTAEAISKIKVQHRTIQNEVQREILEKPVVYRDCAHTDDGLRNINEAITGRPQPASGGGVSGANPAD